MWQAVRNQADLSTMACPDKYRSMQGFYKYYSGEKVAPVLTIFIGGNHEASNHLWELYHGGWVAPNIYFLGYAGVVTVGGVRIGGLTGIFNSRHYKMGHYETPPYSDSDMRSAYHIREFEVFQLLQLREPLDIFLSHDWPQYVCQCGNVETLFRKKKHLVSEVQDGSLGSPPGMELLKHLQPSYWFSAHLHVKYSALVQHSPERATRFLALDKCLPERDFLQLLEIPGDGTPAELHYDPEWLAVLRNTMPIFSVRRGMVQICRMALAASAQQKEAARECAGGDLSVPLNFCITAPPYWPGDPLMAQPSFVENPQTKCFVRTFGLPVNFRAQQGTSGGGVPAVCVDVADDEESDLGDD